MLILPDPADRSSRGMTLIELMITITLMALLAYFAVVGVRNWKERAEDRNCQSRLKGITVCLSNYLVQKESWPQVPETVLEAEDEEVYWKWWYDTLKDQGLEDKNEWHCPTEEARMKRHYKSQNKTMAEYWGSYVPTEFEEGRDAPYRYRTPWVIEVTENHDLGQNAAMADGIYKFRGLQVSPGKAAPKPQ